MHARSKLTTVAVSVAAVMLNVTGVAGAPPLAQTADAAGDQTVFTSPGSSVRPQSGRPINLESGVGTIRDMQTVPQSDLNPKGTQPQDLTMPGPSGAQEQGADAATEMPPPADEVAE